VGMGIGYGGGPKDFSSGLLALFCFSLLQRYTFAKETRSRDKQSGMSYSQHPDYYANNPQQPLYYDGHQDPHNHMFVNQQHPPVHHQPMHPQHYQQYYQNYGYPQQYYMHTQPNYYPMQQQPSYNYHPQQ
jgi:hypothetical protein